MIQSQFKRHVNFKHWTAIPNHLIRSKLSNPAFRVLCYLASHTEEWNVYQSIIMKDLDWGREMLRNAIIELVKEKYIIVKQQKNEEGQFTHNNYEYDFYPIEHSNNVSVDGFPAHGFPAVGEPPTKNTLIKEDQYKEEKKEDAQARETPFSLFSISKEEYEKIRMALEKEGYSDEHVRNVMDYAKESDFWSRTINSKEGFIKNFKTMKGQAPKLESEMSDLELIERMVARLHKEYPLSKGKLLINKDLQEVYESDYRRTYPFSRGANVIYRQILESYGKC